MVEAKTKHYNIAIVGAGFAGMAMAIRLIQAGRRDFVIFEKDDDVGGTWKVNDYPGCACDVPSHLYSLSCTLNPDWSRSFSGHAEIWAYQRALAKEYDLYANLQLNTQVVKAEFSDDEGIWRLQSGTGEEFSAQTLIAGMGGLSEPSIPKLPGAESFEGPKFHSQDWDHEYDLKGKRVAVIGTGASAIQFVPQIAQEAEQVHLFQRTAPWIMPKEDHAITDEDRAQFREFPWLLRLKRWVTYWGLEWRASALVFAPVLTRAVKRKCIKLIEETISDPELRAAVTPNYMPGCKRILLSNDYYPALARENVELVTSGVQEVKAQSIVSKDGTERPIDALIYGTGFKASDPVPRGVVFGRNGQDLLDAWSEGPEAYKGTTVAGFPNLFFVLGPNTGLGHTSVLVMMEAQVEYIMGALSALGKREAQWCDVRPEVQTKYNRWIQERMAKTVWSTGGCNSWYTDAQGKNVTLWPGFTVGFRRMMKDFDEEAYEWGVGPSD